MTPEQNLSHFPALNTPVTSFLNNESISSAVPLDSFATRRQSNWPSNPPIQTSLDQRTQNQENPILGAAAKLANGAHFHI